VTGAAGTPTGPSLGAARRAGHEGCGGLLRCLAVDSGLMSLLAQLREDWLVNGRSWTKPGFHALAVYRFGVWGRRAPTPLRPVWSVLYRLLFVFVRNVYGIELHRTTRIGRRLAIAHQGGIVVHPQAVIGDDCALRHNVTLGAATFERLKEAPRLGHGVQIGTGAVILGTVVIGDGAKVGPNAVVLADVPPGATAFAAPARVMLHRPGGRDGQPQPAERVAEGR